MLGIINILFPSKLAIQGALWGLEILTASVIYGLIQSWPRPIEQFYSLPNTTIRVVKGDLLEETGHLVIGTCDTFDTQPPNFIARDSLQGQALDRLFGGDVAELDRRIGEALSAYSHVDTVEKPGKQLRYELGTIAVLRSRNGTTNPLKLTSSQVTGSIMSQNGLLISFRLLKESGRNVFFVAYSQMDEQNQARSTPDNIWKSLLNLWAEVSRHGNGGSVSIPVIGGGQSRIAQVLPAQDSIRFIALSFMLAPAERSSATNFGSSSEPQITTGWTV